MILPLVMTGLVLLALALGYSWGAHDGYHAAWKDIAKATRKAEMENHGWPE